MQTFEHNTENISGSPFKSSSLTAVLANTSKRSNQTRITFQFISYCQKQNMIIACCNNYTLKFYDATTLLLLEDREHKLDGCPMDLSFDENDTFLIGFRSGSIYSYSASNDELRKIQGCEAYGSAVVSGIAFLSSSFYAFSLLEPRKLCIGNFNNDNLSRFDHQNNYPRSLCYLPKSNLLLSELIDGSLRIFRTNKLPNLRMVCSIQAHETDLYGIQIHKMDISGKEYVVTSSREDQTLKIWHFHKGKMRLLRVIHIEGQVNSLVYLENYKMIAIAYYKSNEIKFFNVFSGKLEKTFVCEKTEVIRDLFLMKDKNMIGGISGVPGSWKDSIEFIQLHSQT